MSFGAPSTLCCPADRKYGKKKSKLNEIVYYSFVIVAVLISLTVHEFSHAYTAYRLGDPTPSIMGRLSMNPARHLDPIGALAMIFFRVGWAKPVPIDPRFFKKPKRDMAITGAAGPLSNILLAFFACFFALLFQRLLFTVPINTASGYSMANLLYYLAQFFAIFHILNLSLAIFNLLPITPLDGSRILYLFLPRRALAWFIRNERRIYLAVIIWLILGDRLAALLLKIPAVAASPLLTVLITILSLTGWITIAAEGLSGLMIRFWTLLPFLA